MACHPAPAATTEWGEGGEGRRQEQGRPLSLNGTAVPPAAAQLTGTAEQGLVGEDKHTVSLAAKWQGKPHSRYRGQWLGILISGVIDDTDTRGAFIPGWVFI